MPQQKGRCVKCNKTTQVSTISWLCEECRIAEQFKHGCPNCGCPDLRKTRGLARGTVAYRCDNCRRLHHVMPEQAAQPRRSGR